MSNRVGQVIELLVGLVKPSEGLHRLRGDLVYPYICPAGYATQGYGLLVDGLEVPAITRGEAERRLMVGLPYYVNTTFQLCPQLLLEPPGYQAAISDFTFNLGAARLRASTLRRRINSGDWRGACSELVKWVHGGGRRLPGLIIRRALEVKMIQECMR